MPYKLIAIDLDGTLLNQHHQITPGNRTAIAECRARGLDVRIATGRMFASVGPYARSLELAGQQITLNGAVLADVATGQLTTRAGLTPDQLVRVVDRLVAAALPYSIFAADAIYAEPGTHEVHMLTGYGEPPAIWFDRETVLDLPHPIKVLTFVPPGQHDDDLAAEMSAFVEVVRTSEHFLEFLAPGVSKGAALAEIIAHCGVQPADVLAIGDNHNDISMFRVAGMSIAMGNAPAAVQAQAQVVTGDCEHNGVAQALWQYVLGG